jgi:hypothetical protein
MADDDGKRRKNPMSWAMGALVIAAIAAVAVYYSRSRASVPAAKGPDSDDSRVEAATGQLRQAIDDKLRDQASRPQQPVPDGGRVVELSAEQLSGMLHRVVKGGLSGEVPKGDDISQTELASLPLPPFAGAGLKSFRRLPHWPKPGAYMMWVEGTGEIEKVVAHYLAAVQKGDPTAKAERNGTRVKIRSEKASADVDISIYEDGTTVSAQVTYGGW